MELITDLMEVVGVVSAALGKPIDREKYEVIDRGVPHFPPNLPAGKMAVYAFWYEGRFMKIGRAGPNSNARFMSQHYNHKSARSTLAASLLKDENMRRIGITEQNVGDWIKENCRRVDVLLDADLGVFALELVEAALHYKYEPVYEGFVSQRKLVVRRKQ